MSSKGKKRKRAASPDLTAEYAAAVQKIKFKPMPELPAEEPTSGKKHTKKRKRELSPISAVSPTGGDEDGGLKMKIILSPKKIKAESSPEPQVEPSPPRKGKKKDNLKAKLVFEDQVLTLDGETVTHEEVPSTSKKGKSTPKSAGTKQTPSKKKSKDSMKIKEEPIPPFTKVPKSADRANMKAIKVESDSGYSDTPTTSSKGKKGKAKMIAQTIAEETPVPSPQASDISRDSSVKKKKSKDKDKKKKKMFKFKGDRNRFLNVRELDDEAGDSLTRSSFQDEDSLGGFDTSDFSYNLDSMMPQMPVPDYNLEKKAADELALPSKTKVKREDGADEIQSGRAEDLIFQLTAGGSDMDSFDTIYPSYMEEDDDKFSDDGWIEKKKKKKKFAKDKRKKKKDKQKLLERDEHGNVKYIIRKTRISGYMLWCRSYRPTFVADNPGLDFSAISRRMGALWKTLDENEKDVWRKREMFVNTKVPMTRFLKKGKPLPPDVADLPPFQLKTPEKKGKEKKLSAAAAAKAKKKQLAKKKPVKILPPRWQPIDCAAYMRLLGCSLSDVGRKLQTHKRDDMVDFSGSMGVLLDSMLCAMGPLLCLTDQVPALQCMTKKTKSTMLDNIAYIMPGL